MKHKNRISAVDAEENRLLTAYEVQDILGMDINTIYTLLKKGTIPGKKFGAQWRIPAGKFYEFLEETQF